MLRHLFFFSLIPLLLAGSLYSQTPGRAVTTVARSYQSPDNAFVLDVPSGWLTRKEEGSNEVSFVQGEVNVSVGTVPASEGETVERWIDESKLLLKHRCPAAEIQTEGQTKVAGAPGVFFTMYCAGPHPATTVRESAALLDGKIFTFNVTAPTLQLAGAQAAIDSMAKSFHGGSNNGYHDPQHRFLLDIPAGWTLAQRGDNGLDGVMLTHDKDWISVTPKKGVRLEEALADYSTETQRAYTDLQQGEHGHVELHGHRALTDSFTGTDGKGIPCFIGITDIDMGRGNSVVIRWSALPADAAQVTEALQKLQQGLWF